MQSNFRIIYFMFFVSLSLSSYSVESSTGLFQVFCDPTASAAYKKLVQSPRPANWKSQLLQFANNGERDAIRTIVVNLKDQAAKEGFLRNLVRQSNKAAPPILARLLDDQENPECLQWYRKSEDAYEVDIDFRMNFAKALLLIEGHLKSSLNEAWELLKAWEKEDMTTSEEDKMYLNGSYVLLFQGVKKLEHLDLVRRYIDWESGNRTPNAIIRRAFITTFEGTPYINLIAKEKEIIPVLLPLEKILEKGHIAELVLKILKRNKGYAENVLSVVVGNLFALLQDKKLREFPINEFKDFNCDTATLAQLTSWAREIINKKRQDLVAYGGNDIMLKTQFAGLDNSTLEKYVVSAFKDMFALDPLA